jgi:hypothetical protein
VNTGRRACGDWLQVLQFAATGCNWLQFAATGCNWLQFAATGCNWLQTSATWFDPV